jgi:hypothetical protein
MSFALFQPFFQFRAMLRAYFSARTREVNWLAAPLRLL